MYSYITSIGCVYPSNFAIDTFLYNKANRYYFCHQGCVYPSNFAIDTFLYNLVSGS